MNRFFSSRFLVAATLATAALGATTAAQAARPDIFVSVDFQSGPSWGQPSRGYYVQPQPVYVQPRPVYVQPAQVYVRPPVFVSPHEVYQHQHFGRHDRRFEWERERAWRHAEWNRHQRHDDFRGWGRGRDDRNEHHGRPGGHWN